MPKDSLKNEIITKLDTLSNHMQYLSKDIQDIQNYIQSLEKSITSLNEIAESIFKYYKEIKTFEREFTWQKTREGDKRPKDEKENKGFKDMLP